MKTKVKFVCSDTDQSGMNYFIQNMIPSYNMHTESFFTPQFFVNHPVYAITMIFICLLRDKASNAEFFQIFPCEPYHTYSTFRLLSLQTKQTIAYSNPTASCLSPRLKSTGNNLGETKVYNCGQTRFSQGETADRNRGKITANGSILSGGTVGYVA